MNKLHNSALSAKNIRNVWSKPVKRGGPKANDRRQALARKYVGEITIYRGDDAAARLLQSEV